MRAAAISLTLVLTSTCLALVPARHAAAGEIEQPTLVPTAKVTQQVGLTEIAVDYECPAVQGRRIWGGIVPYDQLWMIGGASGAKIKFTREVRIGERAVPAGTYWLAALPGKSGWTFTLSKDGGAAARAYRPEAEVVRVRALPKTVARRERLLFTFSDINEDGASLDLEWDYVRVSLPIQVNTAQKMLASISGLDGTWRAFANAARYMLESTRDFDSGLKYIDQALALKDDWYCMWIKGSLLAAKGDYRAAGEWAVKARDYAQQAGTGTLLAADLDRSIADWTRKGGGARAESEAQVLKKANDEPALANGAGNSVARNDEAPREKEPAQPPASDPPLLHRARLRRR